MKYMRVVAIVAVIFMLNAGTLFAANSGVKGNNNPAGGTVSPALRAAYEKDQKANFDKLKVINKAAADARKANDTAKIKDLDQQRRQVFNDMIALRSKYPSLFPAHSNMPGAPAGMTAAQKQLFDQRNALFSKLHDLDKEMIQAQKNKDNATLKSINDQRKSIFDQLKSLNGPTVRTRPAAIKH